jgi:Lrp/AsnC family leucine-responsive transcriptional regulator
VIRERTVRLDPRALGLDLTALIYIRMDRHTPERFEQFEAVVRAYPEVQECYLITGQEADYQLKITVPNMDEYQRFLLNKITRIEGVIGVHSSFVLRKAIDTTALPLAYARRAAS